MKRPRVGFIIQRYGAAVFGGAEIHCRALVQRLAPHWSIELLTTRAVDHMTWADALPAGVSDEDGVAVRRFGVDRPRNVARFNRLSARILAHAHTLEEERAWMALQGPTCSALQRHLETHARDYDGFVLFNYLYATTYDSLPRLGGRPAYLLPLTHDEPPVYLRIFEDVFRAPTGLVFNTPAERAFVGRRFPFALPPHTTIGMGIDLPADADGARFRAKFGIDGPFMLYAGRIDESKGCDDLLRDFLLYRERLGRGARSLALVLCGAGSLPIPRHDAIRYVGRLNEQEKWDALAAARCLVLPSRFESMSIVVLEAWAVGTPVLVNGLCAVSEAQCRRSGGGLFYRHGDEFGAAADWLAHDDALCARLGAGGRAFVREQYAWPVVVQRHLDFIRFDS